MYSAYKLYGVIRGCERIMEGDRKSGNIMFLFDLDGTVTRKEILPEIAKEIGIYKEIKLLTDKTISGKVPFYESFLHRVELFKDIPVSRIRNIISGIPLHEEIVRFIRENKDRCCIVTGNLDVWVDELCDSIGVNRLTSKAICRNDRVVEVTYVLDKGKAITEHFGNNYAAVGEGNNDAEMIRNAEIGIAFGGIHQPAKSVLSCATHVIYEEEVLCRFLRQLL